MDCYQIQTVSCFAFGQSSIKPEAYVRKLAKMGYAGGGIADPQSLFGWPYLEQGLAKSSQLVSFYGMLVSIQEKNTCLEGELIVLDETGYLNLIEIFNLHKTVYDLGDLNPFSKGLGLVLKTEDPKMKDPQYLEDNKGLFYQLSKMFNPFFFGIEIYSKEDAAAIKNTRDFILQHSYSGLAFPKVLYLDKDDGYKTYRMLEAISKFTETRGTLTDDDLKTSGPYFLLTPHVVGLVYSSDEVKNQSLLAKRIHFSFMKKRGAVLTFGTADPKTLLHTLAEEGLKKKLGEVIPEEYQSRLEYELGVIDSMGFDDYFLIVQDYVLFAKKTGIKVGPGRGSGAGALVSYALDITEVDPVRYGLLFERFLNPLRQTMPDIDMDFQDDRREDVISYLKTKYGPERVAKIVTFNTLQLRAAIRQVGNVFSIKPERIDALSKMINPKSSTFQEEINSNYRFKKAIEDPYYKDIIAKSSLILDYPMNTSVHASGVLVTQVPLKDCVPSLPGETLTAGYEYQTLEAMGFLKFDILALNYMTLIAAIEKNIQAEGKPLPDVYQHLADPKAYETMNQLRIIDIFQLDASYGALKAIKAIQPTDIEGLSALIALNRPGPSENIPAYAARKNQGVKYTLAAPALYEILKDTYGIIIYQEQILEIAKRIGGFSGGEADLFRRAISKKDAQKMASMKDRFISGAQAKGLTDSQAKDIYELIARFADYGFNKSHSFAYAFITYTLLYYKANYPSAFYLAALKKTSLGDEKTRKIAQEMYACSYTLASPSVNLSSYDYVFSKGQFIVGFGQIRGINERQAAAIITEREKNGPYKSIEDFFLRVDLSDFQERDLESLINAGCFDLFNNARRNILSKVSELINSSRFGVAPSLDKSPEVHSVSEYLDEFASLGAVLSFKLSDLLAAHPVYATLYLVADEPKTLPGKDRTAVDVLDGFARKTIYLDGNPGLSKYDIISVNEDRSGRFDQILNLHKEALKA
jgi:DNA-directed DNA polymerase III PolC